MDGYFGYSGGMARDFSRVKQRMRWEDDGGTETRQISVHDGDLEAVDEERSARAIVDVCWFGVLMSLLAGPADARAARRPACACGAAGAIGGHVSLEPAGTDEWTQAVANTPLTTGDRLYVNHEGHAELQMGGLAVRVWKFTDLTIVNLANDVTQLGVAQGSVHVRTFALGADSQWRWIRRTARSR